jgi:exodeoxyribonuclease V alpha subunit
MPPHESAFALTIHKAQGSEYDEVLVLLPPAPEQPILSHPLLYTAASRARTRLELAAGRDSVAAALAARTERASGLADRL